MIKRFEAMKQLAWVKAGLYVLLLAVVYKSALEQLVLADWGKEDYSHCWLIPFVLVYLLWEKRKELAVPSARSWAGIAPFGAGIALFWLGGPRRRVL